MIKINEDVYLLEQEDAWLDWSGHNIVHDCGEAKDIFQHVAPSNLMEAVEDKSFMILRENDDGPMYWCEGCGYTLEDGEAMAVRLFEADFYRSE